MPRNATAQWQGTLEQGNGTVSTASGVLVSSRYSYGTRFENAQGTNPEELIGAAHASCFSMALAMILGQDGLTADNIETQARVRLSQADDGFVSDTIHLDVSGQVPDTDVDGFQKAAEQAKANCPISKLVNAEITMEARLES